MTRLCAIEGCRKPGLYVRGLCSIHQRANAKGVRPLNSATMPDIPETCEPITPNPAHYHPWDCPGDTATTNQTGRGGSWSAWRPMRAVMTAFEERDVARDERDAERYEFVATERGLIVRERDEVA